MTLTELRYIVMLARERHFGRAAEKCHVSQPTLSVALKKVEHKYGVILFERTPSEVRLTPTGEQIARQGCSYHDVLCVSSHRAQGVGVGGWRMAQLELE